VIAFFDASALTYLIEARAPFAGAVRAKLSALAGRHPGMGTAVSRLSARRGLERRPGFLMP
jgi:hypothetical protein